MEIRITADRGQEDKNRQACIQAAIDGCRAAGGGRVILSPGIYVTGTICLKDRVTLTLEKGALLLGSGRMEDYPETSACFTDAVGHKRGRALLYAYGARDIALEGEGVIDGRGGEFSPAHPHHLERPFLVRFLDCRGAAVRGVTLRQSPAWCLHLQDCDDVDIEGITIFNRCNGNNDGIDIDGCERVRIRDCAVDAGDDALCLKSTSQRPCRHVLIQGCRVSTDWAAFKIGTESAGDFEDIEVGDCFFYDVKGCAVKVVPVDGGSVRGLRIHDVSMANCTGPVFFSTGERLRKYLGKGRMQPGTIEDVTLERIRAEAVSARGSVWQGRAWGNARGCVVLSGLKDFPLRNITLRDCFFSMPGGVTEMPGGTVPRMGDRYPEFHLFDVLPAWGAYLRHGRNILMERVEFACRDEDVRPMFGKEDVTDVWRE